MELAVRPNSGTSQSNFQSDFWQVTPPITLRLERSLLCSVAGRQMAIGIDTLRDVLPMQPVAPLPGTPGWVVGLTSVRGIVVGVIDLASYLGLHSGGRVRDWTSSAATALRLLVCSDKTRTLALVVDATYGVVDYAPSDVQMLLGMTGTLGRHATGLLFAGDAGPEAQGAVILDVPSLLREDELVGR